MKKWTLGLVLMAASVAPAFAALGGPDNLEIRVNGAIYTGSWAYVGDRVYVNVDAFGRFLAVPHRHNVLNWQLSDGGKGNPLQLSVDGNKTKIPAVRFGGTTMVDMEKACKALKVAFHRDLDTQTYDIGSPWAKEYVVGSYFRRMNHRYGRPYGSSVQQGHGEDGASWTRDKWNQDKHFDMRGRHEGHEKM